MDQGQVVWVGLLVVFSDFRIFGFLGFSSGFRPDEFWNCSRHPRGVSECQGESDGFAL